METPVHEPSLCESARNDVNQSWQDVTNALNTYMIGDTTLPVVAEAVRDHMETLPNYIHASIRTAEASTLYTAFDAYQQLQNLHGKYFREIADTRKFDASNFTFDQTSAHTAEFTRNLELFWANHANDDDVKDYAESLINHAICTILELDTVAIIASHAQQKRERFQRMRQKTKEIGKAAATFLHAPAHLLLHRGPRHLS